MFGKRNESVSPIEGRSHKARLDALRAHETAEREAFAAVERSHKEAIQTARETADKAIADAKAKADATRATINRTLAAEIHYELCRLVSAYDNDPKGATALMVDEWARWNAQALDELGEGVSHAHLHAAFRHEAGRLHFYRHGATMSPIDYEDRDRAAVLRKLVHALESKDRVLASTAIQAMRVAVRTHMPGSVEHAREERTKAIVCNVTEREQRIALEDCREPKIAHATPNDAPRRVHPNDGSMHGYREPGTLHNPERRPNVGDVAEEARRVSALHAERMSRREPLDAA